MTSDTLVASGLASTPSSWTDLPALPSSSCASTIDWVVSGQTVVHSESSKDSMTTRPRNWLSDICWPNWLTSLTSGAALPPSEVPVSRLGFSIAAAFAWFIDGSVDDDPDAGDPDDEQPATARAAATTGPASQVARRVVLLPRSMPARLSHLDPSRCQPPGTTLLQAVVVRFGLPGPFTRRFRCPRVLGQLGNILGWLVPHDHPAAVAPGDVPPGQVDQRGDPVPAAEQVHQVQGEPGEPGERPSDAGAARELHHGGAAADGGHGALVVVAERLGRLAAQQVNNLVGG